MKALGPTRVLRAAAIMTTVFGISIAPSQTRAFEPVGNADALGDLGARIVAAEGEPGRNPLSSAAGYGQFLSGTWLEMFGRAYPQVAQTMTREQILALRDVKPLAEDLTNRYAQANAAALRSAGLPATAGELSLAHAIGPRGAVSVLSAGPARPAAELLRQEAIAANPFFKGLTAGSLRQWAMLRVNPGAEQQSPFSEAPKAQPSIEPLRPADDFRVDERTNASEALVTNHNAGGVLQDLVDALSKAGSKAGSGKGAQLRPSTAVWLLSVGVEPVELLRGEPAAVRIFDRAASRAVLDAIRSVSDRPAFAEFKAIEARAARGGELPRAVIRALAIALLDKMSRENSTISDIVQHRRNAGAAKPTVERSVPPPLRDAANAGGAAAAPPL
jgi:hypothetical protein